MGSWSYRPDVDVESLIFHRDSTKLSPIINPLPFHKVILPTSCYSIYIPEDLFHLLLT